MEELLKELLRMAITFAIIYFFLTGCDRIRKYLLRAECTLRFRLRFQDYSGRVCKMALVDETTHASHFITEYIGLKFGDHITVRIRDYRPYLGTPVHLSIDFRPPKRIYWVATIHRARFDDIDLWEEDITIVDDE